MILAIKRMKVVSEERSLESKLQIIAEMDVQRVIKFIQQDGIEDVTEEIGKVITTKIVNYMEQY